MKQKTIKGHLFKKSDFKDLTSQRWEVLPEMLESGLRRREWLLPSSQPLDKTNLWTHGFMSHQDCRSLCRPQGKAGGGLAANADHCAEPTIDRPTDGEIGKGTKKKVFVSGNEWGGGSWAAPRATPTCPWQFCREGRRDFAAWMSGRLPSSGEPWTPACPRFIPSKPTRSPASRNVPRSPGTAAAGCWSQEQADGEPSHPLCAKDSPCLAKPLLPLPHSPSKLIKVSFPSLRFHHYLKLERSCWIWQELIRVLAVE